MSNLVRIPYKFPKNLFLFRNVKLYVLQRRNPSKTGITKFVTNPIRFSSKENRK